MNKKHTFLFAFILMLPAIIYSQLKVTTNDPDATYEAGRQMNFVVTGGSGTATYTISYDHGITAPISSGTIQLNGFSTNIPFRLDEPGTVICTVTNNGQGDIAGAAFSPFDIQPYEDDPIDFNIFWNNQKNRLASVPISPQFFEVTTWDHRTRTYQFSLGMIDNRRVHGYISIPLNGTNLPAVITHAAFGVGPNLCVPRPEIAADLNAISVSMWMHNAPPDQQSFDAYKPMQWDDENSNYYRYGVLGIMRVIDYIYTRPEFRGSGIGLNGISEGGGMSLLTAGVDDRVTAVSASIFAHSEHTGYKYGKASGFPHYLQQAPLVIRGVNVEAVNQATKYFDVVRAAKRFDGPVMAAIGYEDLTSIPMAQFGGFNQLKGSTVMIHKLDWGHRNPDEFYLGKFEFFRKHLNLSGQKGYYASAGNDQNVSGSATLSADIERFGSPDFSLPVEWEMVSGPGTVNFTSRNSRTTNASFSANGEYILRVTATDKSTLNSAKTYFTISDHVKITVGNSNTNNDNDNDGVPNNVDCNDFNPNISSPGDPCNDFNSNTFNDVIQDDCSCAGVAAPCANEGGDADGDGICAFEDCNDFNQFISRPGDACNDGNANTQNDVIQSDCSCQGTVVDPCASQGGDSDGDGVCDFQDCNRFNPNISEPGDACDDFDPNTTNDVIQNDCICRGITVDPCASQGGDSDSDGVCDFQDCNRFNPNISEPGDACDDFDPNTVNDVIQSDCTCRGIVQDACATQGGDTDGDGVCDFQDCNRFNANISEPGDACDDGNANTENDVIQNDCTCAGTTAPPPPPTNTNCIVSHQVNGDILTINSLNYTHNVVNVFDHNFGIILSCADWSTNCNSTQEFRLPYVGKFFVQIQTYTNWSNQVCNIFEPIESTATTTNACQNLTNGGSIEGNETFCTSELPSPITSATFPSGGSGVVEYQWIQSTSSCPFGISDAIPGANRSTYTPGALTETTYFRRLSRRAGCIEWNQGISNCIVKQVDNCGTPPTDCEVNYSLNSNTVSFNNVTSPIATVEILRNNSTVMYRCENHMGNNPCPEQSTIQLPQGRYNLRIQTAETWQQGFICNINETFRINRNQQRLSVDGNDLIQTVPFSINEKKGAEIIVFPNPANDFINVRLENEINDRGQMVLINQLGKIVKLSKFENSSFKVGIGELPAGIYFLKIENGDQPITKRIMINRK